jgi:hypothetical protein
MPRSREPLINLVFYHAFKQTLINPFFYLYLKGKVEGTEHVPKTGGFVVVCNHGSNFDPPLLSAAILRPVAYMAKEELFEVPVFKQAIKLYGAYPVKRGAFYIGYAHVRWQSRQSSTRSGSDCGEGSSTDPACVFVGNSSHRAKG